MSLSTSKYRPGVGAILYNKQGLIFAAERIDMPGSWQLPQGGIDPNETPEHALFRELEEEIGTRNIVLKDTYPGWISYDIPLSLRKKTPDPSWEGVVGQTQKWFLGYFNNESDINLHTKHPEFSRWTWKPSEELVEEIVDFKKNLYKTLFAYFDPKIQRLISP